MSTRNANAIIIALGTLLVVLNGSMNLYCSIYNEMEKSIQRSETALNRIPNKYRQDWSVYNERISDRMFFRMYRMNQKELLSMNLELMNQLMLCKRKPMSSADLLRKSMLLWQLMQDQSMYHLLHLWLEI